MHINVLIMSSNHGFFFCLIVCVFFGWVFFVFFVLLRKAYEGWKESYLLPSELFFKIPCEAVHLPPTKSSLN